MQVGAADGSETTTSAPESAPAVGLATGASWPAGWTGAAPAAIPWAPGGAPAHTQFAQPWRQVGLSTPQHSDAVPVEYGDKFLQAEISLPDQRARGVISVRAILDSGAHVTRCQRGW